MRPTFTILNDRRVGRSLPRILFYPLETLPGRILERISGWFAQLA